MALRAPFARPFVTVEAPGRPIRGANPDEFARGTANEMPATAVAVGGSYEVAFGANFGQGGAYQQMIIACRDGRIVFGENALP